jgi:hypothetical protein
MIDAMKQALGVLESDEIYVMLMGANGNNQRNAASALRQAIEQAEKQKPEKEKICVDCGKQTMHMGNKCYGCCQTAQPEPVAWDGECVAGHCGWPSGCDASGCCRADLAPPKREWVGLTVQDYREFLKLSGFDAFKAIEAKLKERNI